MPAALRLRGAGGGCPQISGPRQRACRWLQRPPPGARECARGPLRARAPEKGPLYNQGRANRPRPVTGPGGPGPTKVGPATSRERRRARCPTGLVRPWPR